MRWQVEHVVPASLDAVERAVTSPDGVASLPRFVPQVASAVALLAPAVPAGHAARCTRVRPAVELPAFARGITPEMLEWVETLRWDYAAHAGEFTVEPAGRPEWARYFRAAGTYRLAPRGPGATARVVAADLTVHLAVLGGVIERLAVRQLREQFAGEARWLAHLASAQG